MLPQLAGKPQRHGIARGRVCTPLYNADDLALLATSHYFTLQPSLQHLFLSGEALKNGGDHTDFDSKNQHHGSSLRNDSTSLHLRHPPWPSSHQLLAPKPEGHRGWRKWHVRTMHDRRPCPAPSALGEDLRHVPATAADQEPKCQTHSIGLD